MNRRDFVGSALAAGAVGTAGTASQAAAQGSPATKFKLKYAPHFGMFQHSAGDDLLDQLRFASDQGYTAFEDNGMRGRDAATQTRIAAEMDRLGLTMGVFVAHAEFGKVTFAGDDAAVKDQILADIRDSVEVAQRVNAKWCTVVCGRYHQGLAWDYQTANCIDLLQRCTDLCAPSGLVMVLEPLNPWADHPGMFLTRIAQAYQICRAVDHPSCKILDDLYHQQITEGNLIPNLNRAWTEIAYIQVGDNPGRKEPTTGEINFRSIFRHLYSRGYDGLIGMEHGLSRGGKEGEEALLRAYREVDDFPV